jgi:hypothetical protein
MGSRDGLEIFQHRRVWLLLGWYGTWKDWDGLVAEAQLGRGGLSHAVTGR